MKILVINVSLRPKSPVKLFPVGLGYIVTAIKRAGFVFDLLDVDGHRLSDEVVERRIRTGKYDVVCLGCIVTGYAMVKRLCALIKDANPGCTIIVGNSVATSIVDTLLTRTEADVAVMGEGDATIVDVLQTLSESRDLEGVPGICYRRDGAVARNPARPLIQDISTLPFIDFSIFDVERYIEASPNLVSDPLPMPRATVRLLPVNTARGCVASCTFCYQVFRGMRYRWRSTDSIVAEVEQLIREYGVNYVGFCDELTLFSKKRAIELTEAIRRKGLELWWSVNARSDLFDSEEDLEIIRGMKEAGCLQVGCSLESADPEILKAMKKRVTAEDFTRQTQLLRKAGLPMVTSLVLGYPQETPETIEATFDCCIQNGIYPSAGFLLPQPGSPMYGFAREKGFITDEEDYLLHLGDRQDLRLNMTRMSDEELERHVWEGLKRANQVLGIGLPEDGLIKTQYYRARQKKLE